ncbi:MAG: hypothetical protein PUB87_01750 [Eubacteriaceae bacterium]|nr:hypothetical protein [Eubacteriaceae bacterium]
MKEKFKPTDKYDDIINLPHHRSTTRPHMSLNDRAAQFGSFAALTGHKEAVAETERFTETWIDIDDNEKAELDRGLQTIREMICNAVYGRELPEIKVTYFQPDEYKDGGRYVEKTGKVCKIRDYERRLVFTDGTELDIDRICQIEN